jgi:hypothetical protein
LEKKNVFPKKYVELRTFDGTTLIYKYQSRIFKKVCGAGRIVLIRANPLQGPLEGMGLEIETFWALK